MPFLSVQVVRTNYTLLIQFKHAAIENISFVAVLWGHSSRKVKDKLERIVRYVLETFDWHPSSHSLHLLRRSLPKYFCLLHDYVILFLSTRPSDWASCFIILKARTDRFGSHHPSIAVFKKGVRLVGYLYLRDWGHVFYYLKNASSHLSNT